MNLRSVIGWFACVAALSIGSGSGSSFRHVWAQRPEGVSGDATEPAGGDREAMAVYADAANFQTNGAIDLAIEQWQRFLKQHPDHPKAASAAHYLGVCYMQRSAPDWVAAAKAFARALETPDYDLREESLANRGWCLYAAAGSGPEADRQLLKESLQTYQQLLSEFPKSRYRDRALFYAGEAAYALGDMRRAVKFYSSLLDSRQTEKSALRCDAIYALGVALEELGETERAIDTYQRLLGNGSDEGGGSDERGDPNGLCPDDPALIADVRLRMGDLLLRSDRAGAAAEALEAVVSGGEEIADEDRAYALFRQGYAFAKFGKPAESVQRYERLLQEYPDSAFVEAATLASAQTAYQAGQWEAAEKRFQELLGSEDKQAATEAAHWLARIQLRRAEQQMRDGGAPGEKAQTLAQQAFETARQRLDAGAAGPFASDLEMDAAEALALVPSRAEEALERFGKFADRRADDPLAARALYNAAFTALQLGRHEEAQKFAHRFMQRHRADPLAADVRFIDAESKRLLGKQDEAVAAYRVLLENPRYADNDQRPIWVLRAAAAMNAAGEPRQTLALLRREMPGLQTPRQTAEAWSATGQAQLLADRPAEAAESFAASRQADPAWSGAEEAFFLTGQAQMKAGNRDAAADIWKDLIRQAPDGPLADRARYRLGQTASQAGRFEEAIDYFSPVVTATAGGSPLQPFARYAKGWAEMQSDNFSQAIETLTPLAEQRPGHPLTDDAMLARGISHRNQRQYQKAREDLERFLATAKPDTPASPNGPDNLLRPEDGATVDGTSQQDAGRRSTKVNIGHALYELALIDQVDKQFARSAERLQRILKEVPEYPSQEKVLYELGWSLREAGKAAKAAETFAQFVQRYPQNKWAAEAAYFAGQHFFDTQQWEKAEPMFAFASERARGSDLEEKSLYRLGWTHFKQSDYQAAEAAFDKQFKIAPDGPLSFDALMMVGESHFKRQQFEAALATYRDARERIEQQDDSAKTLRDPADRQIRELVLLHGGQSAAQLKRWDEAIGWYDELRRRFPATSYLPQVFYETGFAYHQAGDHDQALKFYSQVADNYRNATAARARFMMGEIHFADQAPDRAIPEYQRVMYGFGAEKASPEIKNWQAKSGFEAGRSAELLIQSARTPAARARATEVARRFYQYVIDQHAEHELADQAKVRLMDLTSS